MDIVVMSTDKNLMVPVGGAIVAGYSKEIISQIQKSYPGVFEQSNNLMLIHCVFVWAKLNLYFVVGRASSSQSLDVFITMLSMGVKGYKALITKRAENFLYLQLKLKSICMAHKLQMLLSKNNDLSTGDFIKCYINIICTSLTQSVSLAQFYNEHSDIPWRSNSGRRCYRGWNANIFHQAGITAIFSKCSRGSSNNSIPNSNNWSGWTWR